MSSSPIAISAASSNSGSESLCFTIRRDLAVLSKMLLAVAILSGCSDGSDKRNDNGSGSEPQIVPVIEPADGQTDVTRTSWLTLHFLEPLPTPSSLSAVLDCDSGRQEVTADWVGSQLLVINPKQDLPEQTACTLSWQHENSSGDSSFHVAETGAPAVVAYDRDDDSSLAPFPDDVWLNEADDTVSGYKLALPLPNRDSGVQTLYGAMLAATKNLDGYSPAAPLVVPVPSALDSNTLPITPVQSLDPLATVGLFVAQSGGTALGARVPFYLLQRYEENADGSTAHNLVIFPLELLDPRQHYVLVVTRRALVDVTRPLEPSSFFGAAVDGELSNGTAAGQRVQDILQEILPMLEHSSPPIYSDDVALALRLTIRSDDALPVDALSIRSQLQELPVPSYAITSIEEISDPETGVAALVYGTWDVPQFREGSFVARDAAGLPLYTGTVPIPFVLSLPDETTFGPVPITMYQHGQPGTAEEGLPRTASASSDSGHALIGFTDIANREIIPDGGTAALTQAIFQTLLIENRTPEYIGTLPLAEQLAFIRMISGLGDLDVFPVGAPDGVPDLDVAGPLTYLGISKGSTHGTRLVPYAPEIRAAHLAVAGERLSAVYVHQASDSIYDFASQFFPGLTRTDLYVSLALLQMGYEPQDAVNHTRYMYRAPHDLQNQNRASLLVTAGLEDTYVPPYSTETAASGFGIPHLEPVQSSVPSLEVITGPVSENIRAGTTAAYYQYVPVGVEGVAPTPGCEAVNETDGHFCAQRASEAQQQSLEFFRSATEDNVPTIIDPLGT